MAPTPYDEEKLTICNFTGKLLPSVIIEGKTLVLVRSSVFRNSCAAGCDSTE